MTTLLRQKEGTPRSSQLTPDLLNQGQVKIKAAASQTSHMNAIPVSGIDKPL